jgi:hypothetical protein
MRDRWDIRYRPADGWPELRAALCGLGVGLGLSLLAGLAVIVLVWLAGGNHGP